MIAKIIEALKGKKTTITVILMFILGGAVHSGMIQPQDFDAYMAILTGLGLGAVRLGIDKK